MALFFRQQSPFYKRIQKIAHKSAYKNSLVVLLTERSGNQSLIATQFCNQVLLTKRSGNQVLLTKPRSYAPPVCTLCTPCLCYNMGHVPFSVYTMGVGQLAQCPQLQNAEKFGTQIVLTKFSCDQVLLTKRLNITVNYMTSHQSHDITSITSHHITSPHLTSHHIT